ncbi:hypothetical protein GCM10023223_19450 [Stackebrandtia albiflava]
MVLDHETAVPRPATVLRDQLLDLGGDRLPGRRTPIQVPHDSGIGVQGDAPVHVVAGDGPKRQPGGTQSEIVHAGRLSAPRPGRHRVSPRRGVGTTVAKGNPRPVPAWGSVVERMTGIEPA